MPSPVDLARVEMHAELVSTEVAVVDRLLASREAELVESLVACTPETLVHYQARVQEVRTLRGLLKPPRARGSGQGESPSAGHD